MARFKIVEKTIAFKEYWIDNVNSFEDAQKLWEQNTDNIDEAASCAEWEELSDMVELYSVEDEKGHIEYYN